MQRLLCGCSSTCTASYNKALVQSGSWQLLQELSQNLKKCPQSQAESCERPHLEWMKNKKLLWTGQLARQLPFLHPVHLTLLFPLALGEFPQLGAMMMVLLFLPFLLLVGTSISYLWESRHRMQGEALPSMAVQKYQVLCRFAIMTNT